MCPTRYRTRHLFNYSNTNEDIATKFEQEYFRISPNKSSIWALSKKLETNILISGKIVNEMPGSVASGTSYITHNLSMQAATNPRRRPRGHWDQQTDR